MNWFKRLFTKKQPKPLKVINGRSNKELLQLLHDKYEIFIEYYNLYPGLCAVNQFLLDTDLVTYKEYHKIDEYLHYESIRRKKLNDYWAPKTDTAIRFEWLNKTINSLE